MKTAIIYVSKYGTTAKVAGIIAGQIGDKPVELIDLKQKKRPDISGYDQVILGTSIYAGSPTKTMKKYVDANLDSLMSKRLILYVCGMEDQDDKRKEELRNAYPGILIDNAWASGFLGGEFLFEKMNFLERAIIKKISKTETSKYSIDKENIDKLISDIKR